MKTFSVVTLQTYYIEERNERKRHSKQDRIQFAQKTRRKRVPQEHFNLPNNFIGVLIQSDMSEMKEISRNAETKGRH